MNNKKNIIIVLGRYLPGYKGGGPGRSIANLVENLGDEYNFYISCYDRDLGSDKRYSNIQYNNWNKVGKGNVWYLPEEKGYTLNSLITLYKNMDIIYLCGCFNDYAIKTLILKKIGIIKNPIVIAAMGLFSPLAFKIKYKKKKIFISLFNMLGLFKKVFWSATTEIEAREIYNKVKTSKNKIFVAQDLPRKVEDFYPLKEKEIGQLKMVFISRISRKKNLNYAIQILQKVNCDTKIVFDVYGPNEDSAYWYECLKETEKLPKNIEFKYCGEVKPYDVVNVLRQYQVFFFPTLGENYGHVIQEALSAGCLCLISDQTPWLDLEEQEIGYVVPLKEKDRYIKIIQNLAGLNSKDFQYRSRKAVKYAVSKSNLLNVADGYRKIFEIL